MPEDYGKGAFAFLHFGVLLLDLQECHEYRGLIPFVITKKRQAEMVYPIINPALHVLRQTAAAVRIEPRLVRM